MDDRCDQNMLYECIRMSHWNAIVGKILCANKNEN